MKRKDKWECPHIYEDIYDWMRCDIKEQYLDIYPTIYCEDYMCIPMDCPIREVFRKMIGRITYVVDYPYQCPYRGYMMDETPYCKIKHITDNPMCCDDPMEFSKECELIKIDYEVIE